MKRLKYPKLTFLVIVVVLTYLFFIEGGDGGLRQYIDHLGWFGILIAGAMYAYGFTSPFATVTFILIAKDYPVLLAGLVAGIGSMLADLLIFKLIRSEFLDEINMLVEEKPVKAILTSLSSLMHVKVKEYMIPIIGAIFIASPLPDEIGASMMAASNKVSPGAFALTCYVLNTLGIITILYAGSVI